MYVPVLKIPMPVDIGFGEDVAIITMAKQLEEFMKMANQSVAIIRR